MRVSVLVDRERIDLREMPKPKVQASDVLLKVAYCGICGTDIHANYKKSTNLGLVMGHEISGRIVEVGKGIHKFEEGDRVVFVVVNMGDEYRLPLGFSSDYSECSWITVDRQGNVSVQISRKDYLRYKQALAFDQLTESLGELFIDYFERFKRGEGERIIYELNSVRSNPFS